MSRPSCVLLLACLCAALAGCTQQDATWYEERCLRLGFKAGTADFDACIARDRDWVAADRARAQAPDAGP